MNRRHPLRAGAIAASLLVLITAGVFLKENPFSHGYEIRAVFSSANQLKGGSEVRTAGMMIGQVSAIEPGPGHTALVTMRIDDAGRPIHSDAQLAVKPRLILEGNAYIDMRPGTPNAAEMPAGATVPLARTSVSVQLDQVLDVFDLPTRNSLQSTFAQLSRGLGEAPPTEPATAGAGYDGVRRAVRELDGALGSVSRVARAARGTEPGDLTGAIDSTGDLAAQLVRDPRALADLVTNFDRVTGALADQDDALAATVKGFDAVFRDAPPGLSAIDAALPSVTTLGRALRPALHAAPPTLRKTSRLLDQIAAAVHREELPALLDELAPVTGTLPTLEKRLQTLFGLTRPVTDCISTRVVKTLDMTIEDGPNTSGDPVWLDLMHLFTGLSSFSSAVDGNGGTVRLGVTGGDRNVSQILPGLGRVVGRAPKVNGVRPTWLGYGVNPPFRPDQPCADQAPVNLDARSGPPPSWASGGGASRGSGG